MPTRPAPAPALSKATYLALKHLDIFHKYIFLLNISFAMYEGTLTIIISPNRPGPRKQLPCGC